MSEARTWVIAYDVADHRQRYRLYRLLGGFGEALQKSVFVCRLDDRRLHRLKRLLARQALGDADRLSLFQVTAADHLAGAPPHVPAGADDVLIVE